MAEEPEEMQPKQWRAVARPSSRMNDAIDEASRVKKEARSGVAIAEEQEKRGKQNRKGKNAKQRSCKPSPYGQWKPVPAHALRAQANYSDQHVDGADGRGGGKARYRGQPEIHSQAL